MAHLQIILCVALLAVSVSGQANTGDISGLLGDVNLNDLINAGQKCDSNKISTAATACSNAVAATKSPCPPECSALYKEFNDSCGDLFKTLGLNTLLGSCGQAITSPSSSSPSPPTGIDNTPEPAAGPSGDYNTDYAQPPQPNMDYSQTDYASPPAEAPGTIIPVIAASPSPALESPPSPMPSPSPAPATNTAVLAGLPASCETYYQTILNQSTEDQIACGQALAANPTDCPDVCKTLYNTRPDATCAKDLAAMTANSPPLPVNTTTPDVVSTNPCFAALSGAGSRSSSFVGVVMAGAIAAFMMF